MKARTLSTMVAGGTMLLLATGCEITPKDWGPVTSTYKGQVRVRGTGTFYNDGYQDQSKTTPEWRNATRTYTLRTSLDAQGSRYRADAEPCAQMGWPVPDSCESAFPTFDY